MIKLYSQHRNYYVFLGICSLVYLGLTVFGPVAPGFHNLSHLQITIIRLTIAVPVLMVWLAAFLGAVGFKSYADIIRKSPDGKALTEVSNGLLLLALSIVVTTLVGAFRQIMTENGYARPFAISSNYIILSFTLLAFYKLYRGSELLKYLHPIKKIPASLKSSAIIIMLALYSLYVYSALHNPYRNSTPDPAHYRSNYLPDWLITTTIILPYIVSWTLGIIAAYNLWNYQKHTNGTIYKAALTNLVTGLLGVTFFSIFLQILTTALISLQNTSLGRLLLLVYIIILLYAVGFLYIAKGAKKLARIEEV